MRPLVRPKYFLIHRYSAWNKEFDSPQELVSYMREHQFTKARAEDYWIIYGEGLWQEIVLDLPADPDRQGPRTTSLDCPL
jgi:hypothetical protein